MKITSTSAIQIAAFATLINLFFVSSSYCQQISERSSQEPNYTGWEGGKKILYLPGEDGGDRGAGRYLFVGEEVLPAYYRENGKEYGYRPMEVVRAASDNLRAVIAAMIRSRVLDSAKKNLRMTDLERDEFREYIFKFFTEATFTNLIREGFYYHKESYPQYADYHAWVLFSIKASTLESLISDKVLEVPGTAYTDREFAQKLIEDIQTTVESLDESDMR